MLQIAWLEDDFPSETRSYDHLALQYFYLQKLKKAQVYKLKAFHGDHETEDSVCKRQAIHMRECYKKRVACVGQKNTGKRERQQRHI